MNKLNIQLTARFKGKRKIYRKRGTLMYSPWCLDVSSGFSKEFMGVVGRLAWEIAGEIWKSK